MKQFANSFSLSACALAASLLISACGGGDKVDTTAPTVSITSATTASTVTFYFAFNEALASGSFTAEDVAISGGTAGALTMVTPLQYSLVVTPTAGATNVTATVATGKFADVANNPNTATATNSYTVPSASAGTVLANFDTAIPVVRGPDSGGTGTITTTPPAGGSGSALALLRSGGDPWALNVLDVAIPFTADRKTLSARVYSPTAGIPIKIKIEAGASNTGEVAANQAVVVGWQTLTWTFTAADPAKTYNVLVLLPNLGTVDAAPGKTYFFDDITLLPAAGTPPVATGPVLANFDTVVPVVRGPDSGGTGTITSTPPAGGSGSALALLRSGGDPWALNVLDVVVPFTADRKTLSAKVYSPTAGIPIKIKIEAGASNTGEVAANETVVVGWQTLTWTFTAADPAKTYNVLVLLPNLGTVDAAPGKTYYFDDITLLPAAGGGGSSAVVVCGTTEPTCAPTTVIPAGAITLYSEASATAGFNAFPNWGQATQYSEATLAGNKSLKYTMLNYEGIEFNAVDVSSKGKVHFDFWSPNITSVKVSLISPSKENAVTQVLTTKGWNSVDIDLSKYNVPDLKGINQIKLEATGSGTLYVDNIYFWGTPSEPASGGSTPNPSAVAGSAGPVTLPLLTGDYLNGFGSSGNGVFAGDYIGGVDANGNHATWPTGTSNGLAKNGNIGYFQDNVLSTSSQKLEENGWIAGLTDNAGGVPSFFRFFILTAPASTFANSYMGLFANAPNNGTVDVSSYGSIKFRVWGPAEMYQKSFSPTLEMKLTGPKVAGCTATGSGATEIRKTFVADQKIGAASTYKLSLAGWAVAGVCGTDTNGTAVASVLSKLAQVVVTVPGASFNFTEANTGGTVTTYATGVNLGPIIFTAN